MATFTLKRSLLVEPCTVDVVVPNTETGETLQGTISLKHLSDWPESRIEDWDRISTKHQKITSIIETGKGDPSKNEGELFRIGRAMIKLINEAAINDGLFIWELLSFFDKMQIIEGYTKWAQEVADKAKETNKGK